MKTFQAKKVVEAPVLTPSRHHHLPPSSDFSASLRGEDSHYPIYLVGACERHNFGDMLMPHVVQQLIKDREASTCVGLVDAELRDLGGHRVISCETALRTPHRTATVIHFGGATLGCDLAYGYAMASSGESHQKIDKLIQSDPDGALKYASDQTGFSGETAYVLDAKAQWTQARSAFHAVGLSEPDKLKGSRKDDLLRVLGEADFVGIRDSNGANFLEREGIDVTRMPCGVTMLPSVCRGTWKSGQTRTAMEAVHERFPNGWIAVQVSGYRKRVFKPLIRALAEKCAKMNLGVVFFAAGTAPGHDDVVELAKRANSFPNNGAMFFPSRNIWDIASVISESRMYIGTSLHGRIVSMAAGIPRINLAVDFAKIQSYCQLWEHPSLPYELKAEHLAEHFENLYEVDRTLLKKHATWLEENYLEAFGKMCGAVKIRQAEPLVMRESAHSGAYAKSASLIAEWTSDSKTLRMLKRMSSRKRRKQKQASHRNASKIPGNQLSVPKVRTAE